MFYININNKFKTEYNAEIMNCLYKLLIKLDIKLIKEKINKFKKLNKEKIILIKKRNIEILYDGRKCIQLNFKMDNLFIHLPVFFNLISKWNKLYSKKNIAITFDGYNFKIYNLSNKLQNLLKGYKYKKYLFITQVPINKNRIILLENDNDPSLRYIYHLLNSGYLIEPVYLNKIRNSEIGTWTATNDNNVKILEKGYLQITDNECENPITIKIKPFMDLFDRWDKIPYPRELKKVILSFDGEKYDFKILRDKTKPIIPGLSNEEMREDIYGKLESKNINQ